MMEPDVTTPTSLPVSVRLRCPGALTPGQWHHLAVVLAKDLKKSCKLNAYLNGKPVGTAKVRPRPEQWGGAVGGASNRGENSAVLFCSLSAEGGQNHRQQTGRHEQKDEHGQSISLWVALRIKLVLV